MLILYKPQFDKLLFYGSGVKRTIKDVLLTYRTPLFLSLVQRLTSLKRLCEALENYKETSIVTLNQDILDMVDYLKSMSERQKI